MSARPWRLRVPLPSLEVTILLVLWALWGTGVVDAIADVLGRPRSSAAVEASGLWSTGFEAGGFLVGLRADLLGLGDAALALLLGASLWPSPAESAAAARLPRRPWRERLRAPLWLLALFVAQALRWGTAGFGGDAVVEAVARSLGQQVLIAGVVWGLLRQGRVFALTCASAWCTIRLASTLAEVTGVPLEVEAALDPLALARAPVAEWWPWVLVAGVFALGRPRPAIPLGGFAERSVRAWELSLAPVLLALLLCGEARHPPIEVPSERLYVHSALGTYAGDASRPAAVTSLLATAAEIASALDTSVAEISPFELERDVDEALLRAGTYGLTRDHARARAVAALGEREDSRAAPALIEGVGVHLALRASKRPTFWSRFPVAVALARGQLRVEHLVDASVLSRELGPELSAHLGAALLAVVEKRHGPGAPKALLEAWASLPGGAPSTTLECRERWGRALGALGLSLEEAWAGVLAEALEAREDPLADFPFPRLHPVVQVEEAPLGWKVLVVPEFPVPRGWRVVCRARLDLPKGWLEVDPQSRGPSMEGWPGFFFPGRELPRSPWLQVGLAPSRDPVLADGVWEAWAPPIKARRP